MQRRGAEHLPAFTLQLHPTIACIARLHRGDRGHAAEQAGVATDGVARAGFQGAYQQSDQQQGADQTEADHHRHRQLGVAQNQRTDDEHDDPAQADYAVIGQRRFGDQKDDAQGNQPQTGRTHWRQRGVSGEG